MKRLLFSLAILFLFFGFVSADGADMLNANIGYYIKNNHLVFGWVNQTGSEDLEIKVQNAYTNEYESYKAIPMSNEKIDIPLDKNFIGNYVGISGDVHFYFIPKNKKGIELNYNINLEFVNKDPIPIKGEWYVGGDQQQELDNGFTREKYNAYKFGYKYGLTTATSIENANMEGEITRAALAKMMTNFAKNILKKDPDANKICTFRDVSSDLDWKYGKGISESCMLGIMGEGISNFRPYDNVTRAEFSAVLSRLLFGTNDGTPYYKPHIDTLYYAKIISNTEPEKIEKRGNVLLMLMRAAINSVINIEDKSVKDDDLFLHLNLESSATGDNSLDDIISIVTSEEVEFAGSKDITGVKSAERITTGLNDLELDNLKKSDLHNLGLALLGYYNNYGLYPNFTGDNDPSKKMINVSLLKNELNKVDDKINYEITSDSNVVNSYQGYKNTIPDNSYGYFLMPKYTITNGGFVLLAKTKTEEGSNFLGSLDYMFKGDLKDFKTCESFKRSEYAGLSSCNATIKEGLCTYCNEDDFRYVYLF